MSATTQSARCSAWLGLALPAALALAAGCAQAPPEQALRETVAGLQDAIEARDASAVQSFLAEDFIGPEGLDRDGARRMATLYLMRHDGVGATLGPLDVAVQEGHARVRFTAVLTTGASTRLLPESARVYDVDTGWRREGGDWRMTSATWSSPGR